MNDNTNSVFGMISDHTNPQMENLQLFVKRAKLIIQILQAIIAIETTAAFHLFCQFFPRVHERLLQILH